MDTTAPSTARPGSRKGRPNYPTELKRRLAQQACEPGVSVSRLAREHGINANMLFKWPRHYRAGITVAAAMERGKPPVGHCASRINCFSSQQR